MGRGVLFSRFLPMWLALAALLTLLALGTSTQRNLDPYGCDPFGYARQAELFRQHGPIGGLRTELLDAQTRFLIGVGQRSARDPSQWAEAIAPHCHHYVARSGKVILQYPPGTGFMLSLFPETKALPFLVALGGVCSIAIFIWLCVRRPFTSRVVVPVLIATAVLFWYARREGTFGSASVVQTLFLIGPACWATALSCVRREPWMFLTVGLLCGALLATRIPNVSLVFALGMQMVISGFSRWPSTRFVSVRAGLWGIGFAITGLMPVMAANYLNAGSVFSTTYGAADTAHSFHAISDGLRFYFANSYSAPVLVVGMLAPLLGLALWAKGSRHYVPSGSIGALLALFGTLGFFLVHEVRIPYYPVPMAMLAVCMVTLELAYVAHAQAQPAYALRWAVLPFAALTMLTLWQTKPFHPEVRLPDGINDGAVVWADLSSGTLRYYGEHGGAKLNFSAPEVQDFLVDEVAARGRQQYFVVDSDVMRAACDRQAARHGVALAGRADVFGIKDVWVLLPDVPGKHLGQVRCDPELADLPFEQMAKVHLDVKALSRRGDGMLLARIGMRNDSAWPVVGGPSPHPLRLSWQFHAPDEAPDPMRWEGRFDLPDTVVVADGRTTEVELPLPVPPAGRHALSISLVAEGSAWFHDHGMAPATYRNGIDVP